MQLARKSIANITVKMIYNNNFKEIYNQREDWTTKLPTKRNTLISSNSRTLAQKC